MVDCRSTSTLGNSKNHRSERDSLLLHGQTFSYTLSSKSVFLNTFNSSNTPIDHRKKRASSLLLPSQSSAYPTFLTFGACLTLTTTDFGILVIMPIIFATKNWMRKNGSTIVAAGACEQNCECMRRILPCCGPSEICFPIIMEVGQSRHRRFISLSWRTIT